MSQVLDIRSDKQMFIDRRWFATSHGISLRVNPPNKAERILLPEMPWELGGFLPYVTVVEDEGETKLWDMCFAPDVKWFITCFAVSRDGIHFERPKAGVIECGGTRETHARRLRSLGGGHLFQGVEPAEEPAAR